MFENVGKAKELSICKYFLYVASVPHPTFNFTGIFLFKQVLNENLHCQCKEGLMHKHP